MKREIKALKQEITKTLKKYELDLEKVVEFAGDIEGMENMNKDETKMTSPKTTMMRYLMLFLRKSWKSMPANPTLKFKAIFDECFICCKNYYLTVEKI